MAASAARFGGGTSPLLFALRSRRGTCPEGEGAGAGRTPRRWGGVKGGEGERGGSAKRNRLPRGTRQWSPSRQPRKYSTTPAILKCRTENTKLASDTGTHRMRSLRRFDSTLRPHTFRVRTSNTVMAAAGVAPRSARIERRPWFTLALSAGTGSGCAEPLVRRPAAAAISRNERFAASVLSAGVKGAGVLGFDLRPNRPQPGSSLEGDGATKAQELTRANPAHLHGLHFDHNTKHCARTFESRPQRSHCASW